MRINLILEFSIFLQYANFILNHFKFEKMERRILIPKSDWKKYTSNPEYCGMSTGKRPRKYLLSAFSAVLNQLLQAIGKLSF